MISSTSPVLPSGTNQQAVAFYQPFLGPSATPFDAYAFINNLNHTITSFMSTLNDINEQANNQVKEELEEENPL